MLVALGSFVLQSEDRLTEVCGDDPSSTCRRVLEWTDNSLLANSADWFVSRPLRALLILVIAWVVNRLVQRAIVRFTTRLASTPANPRLDVLRRAGPARLLADDASVAEKARNASRAETIGLVMRSLASALIWTIAGLTVLAEFDINLGPLIAGAGIAGVALGFGAQTIVRDFLSGMFMLIEDQYGVGDIIDVGPAEGTVEKVSLRTTTIRDVYGTVWHVPNGEILRVGNFSQLWSRALLDVDVAYDTDLRFAMGVVQRVVDGFWQDDDWGGEEIIDRPEVWGVQNLGADGIAIRVVVKTEPSMQWQVERELRLRIKEAFDEAGIEIPYPQRTVWLRNEGDHLPDPKPDPSTIPTAPLADVHDDQASGDGDGGGGDGGGDGDSR